MECIIVNDNKIIIIGKASEVNTFLRKKMKNCRTLKDLILSESLPEVYQQRKNTLSIDT